ncbi:MAG TPA: PKD domain-containing protein [Methanosarcina sp.]|jgi:YVTN family beta-propeller protein
MKTKAKSYSRALTTLVLFVILVSSTALASTVQDNLLTAPYAYITNSASHNVSVIDTATNNIVAEINGDCEPYGVSVTPDGTKVYVANLNCDAISVINTANNTIIATVPVGWCPYGVAVTPDGTKAYVTNSWDNTVSVINTSTNNVVDTVTVGNCPLGVAVNPAGTKVYVANMHSNNVSVINTNNNTIIATVPGEFPYGISVTPDGTKVYVVNQNSNTVSVIDTVTNKVTATVNVGLRPFAFGQFIVPSSAQPVFPVASYSAYPTKGKATLKVQFTDKSTGVPTSWKWNFGDGNTSTEQNPVHIYSAAGNYTVNLTVSNENGNASKSTTITVLEVPVLPGYTNPPTDPNHDDLYEDINGNGVQDFSDVMVYYDKMDWIKQNSPIASFDYNKNGLIDFDDVVKLYGML